jgi:hypothetical protein
MAMIISPFLKVKFKIKGQRSGNVYATANVVALEINSHLMGIRLNKGFVPIRITVVIMFRRHFT